MSLKRALLALSLLMLSGCSTRDLPRLTLGPDPLPQRPACLPPEPLMAKARGQEPFPVEDTDPLGDPFLIAVKKAVNNGNLDAQQLSLIQDFIRQQCQKPLNGPDGTEQRLSLEQPAQAGARAGGGASP